MMTLTEFLLARIAEDEAAQAALSVNLDCEVPESAHWPIPRVLAECEAKRRIVTLMGYVRESWENTHGGSGRVLWRDVNRREKMHALTILENLAAVYADHPDYQQEWAL